METLVALEQEIKNLKNSVNVYLTELRNLAEKYEIDVETRPFKFYITADISINIFFKDGQFYKDNNRELNIYDSFSVAYEIERMFEEKFGKNSDVVNLVKSKSPDFTLVGTIGRKLVKKFRYDMADREKYELKKPIKYFNENCVANTLFLSTDDDITTYCDINSTNRNGTNVIYSILELELFLEIIKELEA